MPQWSVPEVHHLSIFIPTALIRRRLHVVRRRFRRRRRIIAQQLVHFRRAVLLGAGRWLRLAAAPALADLERRDGDPERQRREDGDGDWPHHRQVGLGLRQRVLEHHDAEPHVLNARLDGDGDDASQRLTQQRRHQPAEEEAEVGQRTAGEHKHRRDQPEDEEVRVDADRDHERSDDEEDRFEQAADLARHRRPKSTDEDADGERHDDGHEGDDDADEGDLDVPVFLHHQLTERQQPQWHHRCNSRRHFVTADRYDTRREITHSNILVIYASGMQLLESSVNPVICTQWFGIKRLLI